MNNEGATIINEAGYWECPCGNKAHLKGFRPCDPDGELVSPDGDWLGLYLCDDCGAIISRKGLIVDYRGKAKVRPIKLEKINLEIMVSKHQAEKYGGLGNYKALLLDIIDRYFCEEYFDPDLVEYLLNE